MDKNILINLQRILVFIRADEKSLENIMLIRNIQKAVLGKKGNRFFATESEEDSNMKNKFPANFILVNGEEVEIDSKNIEILQLLIKEILEKYELGNYEELYDLSDAFHIFPELLTQENANYKAFSDVFIQPFYKKWPKSHLILKIINLYFNDEAEQ